jgi:methylenetetrahydrofolate--tRNA-(uracil-5-)-methyltransferase
MKELLVIGGGLSGAEAAYQAAKRGVNVILYEMRPLRFTEAHKTDLMGELVCSNSLGSMDLVSASGLLKEELKRAGSLIMEAAAASRVPAGKAFAVDRRLFAEFITEKILDNPRIKVIREEIKEIPETIAIIATGPLTSSAFASALMKLISGRDDVTNGYLYFYDAISPIIDAESIDYEKVYPGSRYGKGGDDYINCPMNREEYYSFIDALIEADRVTARDFEDERVFEGCMPIEVMALRGRDTLRFGPMKPVGLPDPRNGKEPFAVVQLRPENIERTAFNIVGFQTRLKWPEQKRVFRMIPGLENADFLRYGSIHRNTFINSPLLLNTDLTLKKQDYLYIAGQLTGVEGYMESTAMGLIAGINAARRIRGEGILSVPVETAHGSLIRHITTPTRNFQPSNINFGLLPSLHGDVKKEEKRVMMVHRALNRWDDYLNNAKVSI